MTLANPPRAATHQDLLFGALALQANLIDTVQLADACTNWTARKDAGLADVLVERGWLTPADRLDFERLVARKVKQGPGDPHAAPTGDLSPGAGLSLTSPPRRWGCRHPRSRPTSARRPTCPADSRGWACLCRLPRSRSSSRGRASPPGRPRNPWASA
jgi:hypothetical protein